MLSQRDRDGHGLLPAHILQPGPLIPLSAGLLTLQVTHEETYMFQTP